MSKILVSYFSASGTTKKVAEEIAKTIDGDLFEIEPTEKYTNEDLDWNNKQSRTTKEMTDKNSRPKILNKVKDINDYDVILLGFPIWWGVAPRIINTFIEENNLLDKRVYVFVTSGGSTEENSFNDLKQMYPNINFISCRRFNGYENSDDYLKWLN